MPASPTDPLEHAPDPRHGLARLVALNASALTAGRLLNAALGIVGVAITTRYLGVDRYGALVTVTAFAGLFAALTDMGVWTIGARELAKRPDDASRLMGSMFTIGIGLALAGAVAGLAAGFAVYAAPGDAAVRAGIAILVLAPLPLTALAPPAGAYLVAAQRAYAGAVASTVASVAMLVIVVLAVALDLGLTAVVVANAAQSIAFGVVILVYTRRKISFRPAWDPALATTLLRWAVPLGVVMVLTALHGRIGVILLSVAGSEQDVGIFGLAYKVVETLYVLPAFVMVTLLPELARLTKDPRRRDEIVQKAFTVMQIAAVPLVVLTIAFAGELSTIAGGEDFEAAATTLRILTLGVAAGFLRAVFAEALIAAGRQTWLMLATAVLVVVDLGLNVALIPALGARGAAIAFAASETVVLAVMLALFGRIGARPRPHRPARLVLAGAAMGAATLLKLAPPADAAGPIATTLVLGPLAMAAYVGCLYALRAMPVEVHATLVAPVLAKLRRAR